MTGVALRVGDDDICDDFIADLEDVDQHVDPRLGRSAELVAGGQKIWSQPVCCRTA